jgi:GDPmannose 4,6-dehydratase
MLNISVARIDPRYFRPTEVDLLFGDPTNALTKLAMTPKCDLPMLVAEMMQSDVNLSRKIWICKRRVVLFFSKRNN